MDSTTQRMMASAGGPIDPFFENVTMLLHGDGTNGAQNNTFLDSSSNNFTITRNGNTTQGSLNPFGDRWSNYFDGSGDFLTVPSNTALAFGTGNFTAECWVYRLSTATMAVMDYGSAGGFGFLITSTQITCFDSFGTSYVATATVATNTWAHIAFARSGTTLKTYLNGTEVGSFTVSTNFTSPSALTIGRNPGSGLEQFAGYISNLRLVKGTALYTANFTPPTQPLTAITNTSLLTCQSNRFIDNSSNNFTITRNGDVSVQPFSPFAPSAEYSPSVNGGSAYFDGAGDYLETSISNTVIPTTGNFTVETWVYLTSAATDMTVFYLRGNTNTYAALRLGISASQVFLLISTTGGSWQILSGLVGSVTLGTWNHIAATRSGGTFAVYVNGVSVYTSTAIGSGTALMSGSLNWIGAMNGSGVQQPFVGYISNFRAVNGTAVYTSNFTPPTAPLTAITNTSLLLNFTNAGIIDSAADNVLETVGNAQISTSVKKYGTGSLAFDGSGDNLTAPSSVAFAYGTGDFTWEMWVYPTAANWTSSNRYIIDHGINGGLIHYDSNVVRYFNTTTGISSPLYTNGGSIPANQWTYVVVSRSSGTTRLFVNGNLRASGSDTHNYAAQKVTVAEYGGGGFAFQGYIDDLRITKGVARYTSNFTPPAGPFPNL